MPERITSEQLTKAEVLSFDLWQTLVTTTDRRFQTSRNALFRDTLAPEMDLNDFTAAQKVVKKQADNEAETRGTDVLFPERLSLLCKAIGVVSLTDEVTQGLYTNQGELFKAYPPVLIDESTGSLLKEHKNAGKKLAVVSNTGMMHGDQMRGALAQIGISQLFDTMTFSNEVGYAKPDARIYADMLAQNDVAPEHVIHFGDNVRADIQGASALGMQTGYLPHGSKISDILGYPEH